MASCRELTEARGWTVFAMQSSDECYTSINAGDTYQKHGISKDCREDGLGGVWANSVYEIVPTGIKAILSDL